jgi:uncharacterized protein (DUF1778 family)
MALHRSRSPRVGIEPAEKLLYNDAMARSRTNVPARKGRTSSPLTIRFDEESKDYLAKAAQLRRISMSDYVRTVSVAHAKEEVLAARQPTLALTADEQLAFWTALSEPARLTIALRRLGALMRGKT